MTERNTQYDKIEIGKRLKELRESMCLSVREVAEKLKLSRHTVIKWENGKATPRHNTVLQVAKLYNKTSDYIYRGDEQASNIPEDDLQMIEMLKKELEFKNKYIESLEKTNELSEKLITNLENQLKEELNKENGEMAKSA